MIKFNITGNQIDVIFDGANVGAIYSENGAHKFDAIDSKILGSTELLRILTMINKLNGVDYEIN